MSISSAFRLAIVGAGGIAGAHVGAVKASNGRLSVTAVADPNAENRQKIATGVGAQAFASSDELFSAIKGGKVHVDGLVVCTPPSARIEIIEAALKHKIAVLAEKPIAHTLSDARKLVQIAAAHPGVVSAMGYCHRFTPAVLEMRKLVHSGKIGKLTRFENTFATFFPALKERWMSDPKVSGGGSFIDTGCHSLDLFLFLVGTPKVLACAKAHAWEGRGESSASALVQSTLVNAHYPGVAGVILSGWMEPDRFTVALIGTAGTLSYDYLKPTDLVFTGVDGKSETMSVETHEVRFQRQLEAFADSVQKNAKTQLASFAEGAITAEAVDEAYKLK